jgi:hypothetical protein
VFSYTYPFLFDFRDLLIFIGISSRKKIYRFIDVIILNKYPNAFYRFIHQHKLPDLFYELIAL